MNTDRFNSRLQNLCLVLLSFTFLTASSLAAQQGAATGEPLVVHTTSLPRGFLHQPYQAKLEADGGILPLHWEISEGNLPQGIDLHPDGTFSGSPQANGEFHFTVTLTDSGRPSVQRKQDLVLLVVSPLLLQWGKPPKVNGGRIEGSIVVSNQSDHDVDLTAIIVAVDENGRATALGYQHFPIKKDAAEKEIPFGENLPKGAYQVNVDAVAEVPSANVIYRARLPEENLHVDVGP
ncbi:MAG TPA: Ig domain-containing protein [Terriglobales bacterium]